jgi:hypothetical protein
MIPTASPKKIEHFFFPTKIMTDFLSIFFLVCHQISPYFLGISAKPGDQGGCHYKGHGRRPTCACGGAFGTWFWVGLTSQNDGFTSPTGGLSNKKGWFNHQKLGG